MEETIKSSSPALRPVLRSICEGGNSGEAGSAIASATADGLRVKELAESLGVSMRFVYQMRARGFPMRGKERHSQIATVLEAQDWIKANNFRLVKGVGVTGI